MDSPLATTASAYQSAQRAVADLKHAVFVVLAAGPAEGMKNSQIGRSLGIYAGHVRHQGHISRTLLEMMLKEGVVEQDQQTKLWKLRDLRTTTSVVGDDESAED